MACENNERLLQGYFDGELDLVRSRRIRGASEDVCPDCARELREQQALRQSLRSSNLYEPRRKASNSHSGFASQRKVQPKPIPMRRRSASSGLRWPRPSSSPFFWARKCFRISAVNGRQPDRRGNRREPYTLAATGSLVRCSIHRPAHREAVVRRQTGFCTACHRSGKRGFPWLEAAWITSIIATSPRLSIRGASTSLMCLCGPARLDSAQNKRSNHGRAITLCGGLVVGSNSGRCRM